MARTTKEEARKAAREEAREWVKAEVDGRRGARLPDVSRGLVSYLLERPKVLRALFEDQLYTMCYNLVMETVRQGRRITVFPDGMMVSVREPDTEEDPSVSRSLFRGWMENTGAGHVRLLAMVGKELDAAIAVRDGQMADLAARRKFLALLRAGVRGKKTVGETYTESDLRALWEEAQGHSTTTHSEAAD